MTAAPISWIYDLPAGQHFTVKLQCLQEWGTAGSVGGWVAFGFEQASVADAGPTAASDGNDRYIVEGQSNGMGGAYRKTNAPPPPGSPMTGQYCDAIRAGCYVPTALDVDLGASAPDCAPLAAGTFGIGTNLDASTDTGANVTTTALYEYFSHEPTGIPEF